MLPKGKQVVLGIVTTKTGKLESKDELKRRIDEAAKFAPLDQLCLSGQCGFASTEEGNVLTEDEQWAKLRASWKWRTRFVRGMSRTPWQEPGQRRSLPPSASAVRSVVRRNFPGEYWRALDRERAYPDEFVEALTEAGFLAALIPEEYGGSGLRMRAAAAILEEIHAPAATARACHAQMYTMGTLLRHGTTEQKQRYLPDIARGELRLQAFGVTEPTPAPTRRSLRTTARARRRPLRRQRPEDLDLARRAFRPDAAAGAHHAARRGARSAPTASRSSWSTCARRAGSGLTIRPIRTMMNHATNELFFDDLRVPAENLIGEEGKGFRYILDGMNAERILIAAECIGDAKWFIDQAQRLRQGTRRVRPADRPEPGRAVPDRAAYAEMRAAELMVREAARLFDAGEHCGAEANMAKLLAAEASWEAADAVHADPRRLRLRRGIRHRAQVPRDAALPGRADLDQPDPRPISPSTCSACRGRTEQRASVEGVSRFRLPRAARALCRFARVPSTKSSGAECQVHQQPESF